MPKFTLPQKPENDAGGSADAGPREPSDLEAVDLAGDPEINQYTAALREGDIHRFFDLASALRLELKKNKVVRDRRYHLKSYKICTTGKDMVDYLVRSNQVMSRVEGAAVGCSMVEHGILHHVVDDHHFKDEYMFYRFRQDENDGTAEQIAAGEFQEAAQTAVRLQSYLASLVPHAIKTREYGIRSFKRCFVASQVVEWIVANGVAPSIEDAVDMGKKMQAYGFVNHVCDDHQFANEFLFFRFYVDNLDTDPGYTEFRRMEEGLLYLGHLNGRRIQDNAVPWAPGGAGTPAEYILAVPSVTPAPTISSLMSSAASAGGGYPIPDAGKGAQRASASLGPSSLEDGFSLGQHDPRASEGYQPQRRESSYAEEDFEGFGSFDGDGDGGGGGAQLSSSKSGGFGNTVQGDAASWRAAAGGGASGGDVGGRSSDLDVPWNHGLISREETLARFEKDGLVNGSYLLREYRRQPGWFVLSQCFERQVYHIVIQGPASPPGDYCIEGGAFFASLSALCDFYTTSSHAELPIMLTEPVLTGRAPGGSSADKEFC